MKTQFLKQGVLLAASVVTITFSVAQKTAGGKLSYSTRSQGNSYLNVQEDNAAHPGQTLINYTNGAEKYMIKLKDDKVMELYVDDKKIPADSFHLYNSVIQKIKEQYKKDSAQAEEDRKQAELDRKQAEKDRLQAEKDREQADKDRNQADLDRKQADKDRAQAEKEKENAIKDMEHAERDRALADKDRQQAELDRKQADKDRAQADVDRKQAEIDRKHAEEDRALMDAMINELVKENILADAKSISQLVLTGDEFWVNGKKQPADVHARYKAKYIKKPGYTISINGSSNYGIHINNANSKRTD